MGYPTQQTTVFPSVIKHQKNIKQLISQLPIPYVCVKSRSRYQASFSILLTVQFYYYYYVHRGILVFVHTYHSTGLEVRAQLCGTGSLRSLLHGSVLGMELRSPGLAGSTLSHQAISFVRVFLF